MKMKFHIGCSAFDNPYWKGIFYPEDLPRSKWFGYYGQYFSTYELNGTFYRFPSAASLKSWYLKNPENFRFSVKAPKLITHLKKFADCGREMGEFYTACREGLSDKLACVLFQLPPSFAYSPEKLEMIVSLLDPGFRNVVEFRNESWWNDTVYKTLEKHGIIFCSVSYPGLPEVISATGDIIYVRLHGKPKLFYSGYEKAKLAELFSTISANKEIADCYIYFNNTATAAGIEDALEMLSIHEK